MSRNGDPELVREYLVRIGGTESRAFEFRTFREEYNGHDGRYWEENGRHEHFTQDKRRLVQRFDGQLETEDGIPVEVVDRGPTLAKI